MTGTQIANQIRAYLDFLLGWLKWATGVAIALALFVLVASRYGFNVPIPVSSDVTTWTYLAGIYWLSR